MAGRWNFPSLIRALALTLAVIVPSASNCAERWSAADANGWAQRQPWLVGANYIPATASNTLEMWQQDTFDPRRIDLELGWAESLGMNTFRVFLHDLLWVQDSVGFTRRISVFLDLAEKHHMRTILVLFDSCWDPNPQLGQQRSPQPGVHNSRWVQSPGSAALQNKDRYARLQAYVEGVIGAFANDERILAWDVWNEPDNNNQGSYAAIEPPDKVTLVRDLLPQVFAWARGVHPTQPLTSAVWRELRSGRPPNEIEQIQLSNSDVISFHNYEPVDFFEQELVLLQRLGRPVLCTEYMARPLGSTFESILPIAFGYHVGAINWGLVAGKTQTNLPWDSWQRPYTKQEPQVWFQDVLHFDGTPYRVSETSVIGKLSAGQSGRANPPLPSFGGSAPQRLE